MAQEKQSYSRSDGTPFSSSHLETTYIVKNLCRCGAFAIYARIYFQGIHAKGLGCRALSVLCPAGNCSDSCQWRLGRMNA